MALERRLRATDSKSARRAGSQSIVSRRLRSADEEVRQLADDSMENISPSNDGSYAIGSDNRKYRVMNDYDPGFTDYYLVNTADGSRKPTLNQTTRQRFALAKREIRDLLRRQRLVFVLRRRRLGHEPDQRHQRPFLQRRERHAFDARFVRHRRLDQRRCRRADLRSLRHLADRARRQPFEKPDRRRGPQRKTTLRYVRLDPREALDRSGQADAASGGKPGDARFRFLSRQSQQRLRCRRNS